MTIKLLTPRGVIPVNAILTLDAATEAALVGDKVATLNLAGGFVWTPPVSSPDPKPLLATDAQAAAFQSLVSGAGNLTVPASYSLGTTWAKWDTAAGAGTTGGSARIIDGSDASPDPDNPLFVVKLPYAAGNSAVYDHIPGSSYDLSTVQTLGFWARATPRADGDRYSILKFLFAASAADFANFGSANVSIRADGRWRFYTLNTGTISVAAGSWTQATPVARIRIREGDTGSTTNRAAMTNASEAIYIGAMRANSKQRPMAIVRFDDGLSSLFSAQSINVSSQYTGQSGVVVPAGTTTMSSIVSRFGFVGNAYILTDFIGQPGFETVAGLKSLQSLGWDICFQAAANPISGIGGGIRMLGPLGYNLIPAGGISGVNTSTGVITTTAAENMVGGTTSGQYFPVTAFGTNLTPELTAGQTYYLYRLTGSTFTIHAAQAGSWDGATGKIIPSSSGTLANWGLRYAGSANDSSAILAEFQRGQAWLTANGFTTGVRHYALNQGAWDIYAERAAAGLFDTVMTTGSAVNIATGMAASQPVFEPVQNHLAANDVTSSTLGTLFAPWLNIPSAVQTDTGGSGFGEATIRTYVRTCIQRGLTFGNFHHGLSLSTNLDLLYFLDELKLWSDRGMVDVGRVSDLWARIASARSRLAA